MSIVGVAIVVLLVLTFILELVGVSRSDRQQVDTITEVYELVRDNMPKPLAYLWVVVVVGLLVWTIPHFLGVW